MTKQEAKNDLIEWLDFANPIRKLVIRGGSAGDVHYWFSRCAEMYAAYKAIQDSSTGDDMPIDRPALEMEDFVNDGCNGFTRQ